MNKLLGNTMSWKEVLARFKSPVIVFGLLIMLLNFLRTQFGLVIPVEWIELVLKVLINGGVPVAMGINDATNRNGL